MSHIPEAGVWCSVCLVLTTFPPCTPLGENMTILNTADWLLGCSSPPPAPGSKDYGTEVHVCVNPRPKKKAFMQKWWVSTVWAGPTWDVFVPDLLWFFLICCALLSCLWTTLWIYDKVYGVFLYLQRGSHQSTHSGEYDKLAGEEGKGLDCMIIFFKLNHIVLVFIFFLG